MAFTSGMKTSNDPTWTTPPDFFEKLDKEFFFTLDAAALSSSTLVPNNWYGPDHPEPDRRNALIRPWAEDSYGGAIWLNPPYGREIGYWLRKAHIEAKKNAPVVCLIPSRTDTAWWHDYCMKHEVRFVRGRLRFGDQSDNAPFPSAVVVMR